VVPGLSYIRVRWVHDFPDEPVELWSELDADRFELRKLEIWADGRVGYAAPKLEAGGTRLGTEPVASLEELGSDPQFEPAEVSESDFNALWASKVR
jgi:hypothetical protein